MLASSDEIASLKRKLSHLETQVSLLSEKGIAASTTLSPLQTTTHTPADETLNPPSVPALEEYPSREKRVNLLTARPGVLSFQSPNFFEAESWNDVELIYEEELSAGAKLADQIQVHNFSDLDISKQTIRQLQQSFVEHFLRWIPIFDLDVCVEYFNSAAVQSFAGRDLSTALTMAMLAIGEISDDKLDVRVNHYPGLNYFARANETFCVLPWGMNSLEILHYRILQAAYLQISLHPLQAYDVISQASRDCMHMLNSRKWKNENPSVQHILHRNFWGCSIIML